MDGEEGLGHQWACCRRWLKERTDECGVIVDPDSNGTLFGEVVVLVLLELVRNNGWLGGACGANSLVCK